MRPAPILFVACLACGKPDPATEPTSIGSPPSATVLRAGCLQTETQSWEALTGLAAPDGAVLTRQFDAGGFVVDEILVDEGGDLRQTWDRLPDGRYLEWVVDFGNDGVSDLVETYTYDDDLLELRWEIDSNGDGSIDACANFINEDGLRVEAVYDAGCDGTIDTLYAYVVDDLGRTVYETGDDRLDGRTDYIAHWIYHEETDLVAHYEEDEGGEGLIEFELDNDYDQGNRLVRSLVVDRYGGSASDERLWTYVDADDRAEVGEWRQWNDGMLVQFVAITQGTDANGRPSTDTWTYAATDVDPSDFVLTIAHEWDCPG